MKGYSITALPFPSHEGEADLLREEPAKKCNKYTKITSYVYTIIVRYCIILKSTKNNK